MFSAEKFKALDLVYCKCILTCAYSPILHHTGLGTLLYWSIRKRNKKCFHQISCRFYWKIRYFSSTHTFITKLCINHQCRLHVVHVYHLNITKHSTICKHCIFPRMCKVLFCMHIVWQCIEPPFSLTMTV